MSKTICALLLFPFVSLAQSGPQHQAPSVITQRVNELINVSNGAWSEAQLKTMAKLRDAALDDTYALRQLRYLTDNIGPRLTGSPQAQAAIEYVCSEMRRLGADVHMERVSVPHWIRGLEAGEVVKWPGQTVGTVQKLALTALGGSPGTGANGLRAQVVVADSLEQLKAMPSEFAKGKILLLNYPFDKQLAAEGHGDVAYQQAVSYRVAAPAIGAMVGAAAVLVRSVGSADYRLPHTGQAQYTAESAHIPTAAISAEDADLLANLVQQGQVEMRLVLTCELRPNVDTYNVLADWKGTEHPEQVVIVSGHLDSWDLGTGALDDGAGIVAAMSAIELLNKLAIHPKRTVRFVAWINEESGLDGAKTYAREHTADISNHVAAIESDLGAGHPAGIYFVGNPALSEWLKPIGRVLNPIGAADIRRTTEAASDIGALDEGGVPGFAPEQDSRFYFNYHHTAADTFDKVNPKELNENAAVMTVLAYALADANEQVPR